MRKSVGPIGQADSHDLPQCLLRARSEHSVGRCRCRISAHVGRRSRFRWPSKTEIAARTCSLGPSCAGCVRQPEDLANPALAMTGRAEESRHRPADVRKLASNSRFQREASGGLSFASWQHSCMRVSQAWECPMAEQRIETTININAPPKRVWSILTDWEAMSSWNPFIRSVSGELKPGGQLSVHIARPGKRGMRFKPTVVSVQPEIRIEMARTAAAAGRLGRRALFPTGEPW